MSQSPLSCVGRWRDQACTVTRRNGGRPAAAEMTAVRLAAADRRTPEHRRHPRGLVLILATALHCATPIAEASRSVTDRNYLGSQNPKVRQW